MEQTTVTYLMNANLSFLFNYYGIMYVCVVVNIWICISYNIFYFTIKKWQTILSLINIWVDLYFFFSVMLYWLLEIYQFHANYGVCEHACAISHHDPPYLFPRIIFFYVLECGKIQFLCIAGETIRKSDCKKYREWRVNVDYVWEYCLVTFTCSDYSWKME